ncbi:unnamed protein product [Schistosoma rodhaini]|uniref:Uncharacterized protein n=1 Tax=Schistosoma rodhaini TaxID=6188 RepID=A0AA85FTJ1_9TREM|nr:unnamed protein product [Schistosoma rodhaini]
MNPIFTPELCNIAFPFNNIVKDVETVTKNGCFRNASRMKKVNDDWKCFLSKICSFEYEIMISSSLEPMKN